MPQHILLVDDDPLITDPLARALTVAGYTVSVAHTGPEGISLALGETEKPLLEKSSLEKPNLVVLDIMLPGMDGWELCRQLRRRSTVPILMLTALGDEIDRILGLELGADDYLTKPFSTRELLARVRALLRRVSLEHQPTSHELVVGELRLNLESRQVWKAGRELTLRYKEFELLSLLAGRTGEVVTRAELFDEVWGTDWLGDTRTLDVHIRWLREKIEDDPSDPRYIRTIRGVGYRMVAPHLA